MLNHATRVDFYVMSQPHTLNKADDMISKGPTYTTAMLKLSPRLNFENMCAVLCKVVFVTRKMEEQEEMMAQEAAEAEATQRQHVQE